MSAIKLIFRCIVDIAISIIIILNFASAIIGGIWMLVLGQWKLIIGGIIAAIIMPYVYWIVNLPGMGLMALTIKAGEKGYKALTATLGFITNFYSNIISIVWVIWVFRLFIENINSHNPIPFLLVGYATMMFPLSFMASKEPDDSWGTTAGILYAQVSYFICVLFYFFGNDYIPWLIIILIVGCVISAFTAYIIYTESEYVYYQTDIDYAQCKDSFNNKIENDRDRTYK